jgi:hypothetical protein
MSGSLSSVELCNYDFGKVFGGTLILERVCHVIYLTISPNTSRSGTDVMLEFGGGGGTGILCLCQKYT